MTGTFGNFKKTFGDWFSKAADKAEEFTREAAGKAEEVTKLGKVKLDVFQIKRDMEKKFAELGKNAFQLIEEKKENNIEKDAELLQIIQEIADLKKRQIDKEAEYQKIKESSAKVAKEEPETVEPVTEEVKPEKKSPKSTAESKK